MNLTAEQAYAAMFHFLEQMYRRTKSDDFGALLGSMALLADGAPCDSAITHDWNQAVEYAVVGGKPSVLELKK